MRLFHLLVATLPSWSFADALQELWLVAIQPFTGGVWDAGISMRIGAEIMLEEINKHASLLPGFVLKVAWENGQCDAHTGRDLFLENLFRDLYEVFAPGVEIKDMDTDQDGIIETEDVAQYSQTWNSSIVTPSPVGLMTGCSASSMLVASIAYMARMPLVSNSATRPALSDRDTYPNFFRTILSDQYATVAWVAMAKQLGQETITAVIGQTSNWSTLGTAVADACESFGVTMKGTDMTAEIEGYYGTQITEDSWGLAGVAVENLISFKVRTVLLLLFAPRARLALCQAELQGFVNAIWMVLGWFASHWWQVPDTSCSLSQMNSQTNGMITANMQFWRTDTDTVLGCSETMTTAEFQTEWYGRQGKAVGDLRATDYGYSPALEAGTTADALCMFAQMLHTLLVTENVSVESLANHDEAAYNRAFELLTATDFEGIQGRLTFEEGSADPNGYILCQQVQDAAYVDIATFKDPDWTYFGVNLVFGFEGEDISTTSGASSISGSVALFADCPTGTVLNFATNLCDSTAEDKSTVLFVIIFTSCVCLFSTIFLAVLCRYAWKRRRNRLKERKELFARAIEAEDKAEMNRAKHDLIRLGVTPHAVSDYEATVRKQQSEERGIKLSYILSDEFLELAKSRTGMDDPTFYDMKDKFFYGDDALGKDKICPRDGKPGVSLVDWVGKEWRGKTTHFLSWTWGYKVSLVRDALEHWTQAFGINPDDICLFMCFFVNNQYRILVGNERIDTDDLKHIFQENLLRIGKVVALLDTWDSPRYLTRIWTIFEQAMSIRLNVPVTMVLPRKAAASLVEEFEKGKDGIMRVKTSLTNVHSESAEAYLPEDRDAVRALIVRDPDLGFAKVDRTIFKFMTKWVGLEMEVYLRELVGEEDVDDKIIKVFTTCRSRALQATF